MNAMQSRKIDLLAAGQKKGRWTLLAKGDCEDPAKARWLCRCECGTERYVLANSLVNGTSQSCGCLRRERSDQYHKLGNKPCMGDRIILAFQDDEFSLPLAIADNIPEMCRILGVSNSTVCRGLSKGKRIKTKSFGKCGVVYVDL